MSVPKNMSTFDLYGFSSDDISAVSALLEATFDIKFESRESTYEGGRYFCWGDEANEHFVLKYNFDSFDHEPAELSFPGYPILFYVNDTLRSEELKNKILMHGTSIALLRHEEL